MANRRAPNAATSYSYSLPPGAAFIFHPSEEQLICFYLTSKNSNIFYPIIKNIDLYRYNPFNLPEVACFQYGNDGGCKHWYSYFRRLDVERRWTSTGMGYWKREGAVEDVMSPTMGGAVGRRRTFVFHLANGNNAAATTDWIMHGYELNNHRHASFVLCQVFKKPDTRDDLSVGEITPFCERCVATELRLGVPGENVARAPGATDDPDDFYNILFGQDSDLEDQNIRNPVTQEMEPVDDSVEPAVNFIDGLATPQAAVSFEEAFVELDDLTWPPPGFY